MCAVVVTLGLVACSSGHPAAAPTIRPSPGPIASSRSAAVPTPTVSRHKEKRKTFHPPRTPVGEPVLGYYRYVEFPFGDNGRPVLPDGAGWGYVAPKVVPLEGDGTDAFGDIHWSDWGRSVTYGIGSTLLFWPRGGHVSVAAELRVSDLGRCHGKVAYRHAQERLLLTPGTRKYRVFSKHRGLQWMTYGLSGTHGKICSGPHVL
jgi:hypothetical protein